MSARNFLLFFLISPFILFSAEKAIYTEDIQGVEAPWLTGPLITPSSQVIPVGHVNIEPYVFALATTSIYTNDWKTETVPTFWTNSFLALTQIGLTSWMDLQIAPAVFWNYTEHTGHWVLADLPIALEIQLYRADPDNWIPNVKLVLREVFPIGKYRNLNPNNLGTDAGGEGSWSTQASLVFGKLYHIYKACFFNWRFFLQYLYFAPVHIKGFSVYGGGFGADARVFPGQSFNAGFGMEITLAQNWALALDVLGSISASTEYTGFPGLLAPGVPAFLGLPSSVQYSIAPAIEYNWNADLGVIGGVWFSIAGKNADAFTGGVFALNYYY